MDGLSRSSHLPPPEEEETLEHEHFVEALKDEGHVLELDEALCPEGLIRVQRNDKNLKKVLAWLAENKKMTKAELKEIPDKEHMPTTWSP